MKALELLEELERQIIEWGYINANTTLLFKIKDAIKELEYLIKTKDDEVTIVKTEAIKYNGITAELFVSRSKCLKQIEELEAYCEKGINPERDGEYYPDGYENGKSEAYRDILEKLRN